MSDIQLPIAFKKLSEPKRYKIFFGGRGGAKSQSFARQAIINAVTLPDGFRMLCGREYMNSIEDSVHELLKDMIGTMGLDHLFDIQSTAIFGPNQSLFRYVGLSRNIGSVKSKHNYNVFWGEEAENISAKSWEVIVPTFRKLASEIWISFNPQDEFDATYASYVAPFIEHINKDGFYEDDDFYVRRVNFDDNPWFPIDLKKAADRMEKENYKKWLHIYKGEPNTDYDDSIIEPEWFDAAIDAHIQLGISPLGNRVTSFDPADRGTDNKAYASRHGIFLEEAIHWAEGGIEDAIDKAFEAAIEYRSSDFVYDNVGNGASVKVHVANNSVSKGLTMIGFGGAEGVDNPKEKYKDDRLNKDMFLNKRAQYWWLLRDRFKETYNAVVLKKHVDPLSIISINSNIKDIKKLKSELVKIQRDRKNNRKIQILSKEKMRAQGISSPNLGDVVMMIFANVKDEKRIVSVTPKHVATAGWT